MLSLGTSNDVPAPVARGRLDSPSILSGSSVNMGVAPPPCCCCDRGEGRRGCPAIESSPFLSTGDHPAAILPAIMPAMTVGAPSAELERDLIERERLRESGVGVGAIEPTLSSRTGVEGGNGLFDTELDREWTGLFDLDLLSSISRGCCMANLRLLSRPPLMRFNQASSSRTSVNAAG